MFIVSPGLIFEHFTPRDPPALVGRVGAGTAQPDAIHALGLARAKFGDSSINNLMFRPLQILPSLGHSIFGHSTCRFQYRIDTSSTVGPWRPLSSSAERGRTPAYTRLPTVLAIRLSPGWHNFATRAARTHIWIRVLKAARFVGALFLDKHSKRALVVLWLRYRVVACFGPHDRAWHLAYTCLIG
ncbi:hypothetical protein OPQ81_010892 [Rhizoctonia solani]|nr:hypothetical protein OPQ81_010892 [Rhizoctonia solani]